MDGSKSFDNEIEDIIDCEAAVLNIPGYRPLTPGSFDEEVKKLTDTLGEAPLSYTPTPIPLLKTRALERPASPKKKRTVKIIKKLFGPDPAKSAIAGISRSATRPKIVTPTAKASLGPSQVPNLPHVVDHRPTPIKRKAHTPTTVDAKRDRLEPAVARTSQVVKERKEVRITPKKDQPSEARGTSGSKIQIKDKPSHATIPRYQPLPPPPGRIPRKENDPKASNHPVLPRMGPDYTSPAVRASIKKKRSNRRKFRVPEGDGFREYVIRKGVTTKGRFVRKPGLGKPESTPKEQPEK